MFPKRWYQNIIISHVNYAKTTKLINKTLHPSSCSDYKGGGSKVDKLGDKKIKVINDFLSFNLYLLLYQRLYKINSYELLLKLSENIWGYLSSQF